MSRSEPPGTPLPQGEKALERIRDERWWPLMDAVTRRWEGPSLVQQVELPPIVELKVKINIEVEKWGVGFLSVQERMTPPDLTSALREVAPQALLRDLHRPTQQFVFSAEVKEGMYRPPLTEAYREIRAAQHREPLPSIEPLGVVVQEAQVARRLFLAERWLPHKPDSEARAALEVFRGAAPPSDYD